MWKLATSNYWLACRAKEAKYRLEKLQKQIKSLCCCKLIYRTLLGAYYETLCCIPRMPQDMALPFRGASILAESNAVAENGAQGQPLQPPSPGV